METISLHSSPVATTATLRKNSSEQQHIYEPLHSDESLPSPSTLLKLAPRRPSKTGPAPLRSGSRSAELPSGHLGFSTASAFAKEHGLGSFKAIDLQQYTSRESSVQLVDTEKVEKPKALKKRAAKKDAVPELKLDKKPAARRLSKKKAEDNVTPVDVTATKDKSASIGDLQIFHYEGAKETYHEMSGAKGSKTDKAQMGHGEETAQESGDRGPTPYAGDLQVFQYHGPDADMGESVAVVGKLKPARARAKKGQVLDVTPRPEASAVLDDLGIFEYAGPDMAEAEEAPDAPKAKTRKLRQKKEAKDGQAQLPKPKITKPRAKAKTITKATDVGIVVIGDEHEQANEPLQNEVVGETDADVLREIEAELEQDLALDRAVTRRRGWTPPRNGTSDHVSLNIDPNEPVATSELNDEESPEKVSTTFLNLQGNFGFNELVASNESTRAPANIEEPALKKRRLSPVKSKVATKKVTEPKQPKEPKARKEPKAPKPPKAPKLPRAPAKSSRTVTGIALAQYAPQQDVTAGDSATIAAFFAKPDLELPTEEIGGTAAAVARVIKRKRSRSPAKRDGTDVRPKAKKSTKKVTSAPQKLLSPAAAQKRLENQDILFGTSSQLVREDSPTFIRQLQQAIKESESQVLPEEETPAVPRGRGRRSLAVVRANKGRWLDGARGEEEMPLLPAEPPLHERRLLEAQSTSIDPIETAEPLPVAVDGIIEDPAGQEEQNDKPKASQVQPIVLISSDAFEDIDDVPDVPSAHGARSAIAPNQSQTSNININKTTMLRDLSPNKKIIPRILDVHNDKPPQSGQKLPSSPFIPNKAPNILRPGDSTIISLDSSQPAPSPRKSTPRKLKVLADTDIALSTSPFQDIDDLPKSSPMKPVGQKPAIKRKAAGTKQAEKAHRTTSTSIVTAPPSSPYQDIDKIEDSEPELTSSPPRRHLNSPSAPRNTLELSPTSKSRPMTARQRSRSRSPSPTSTTKTKSTKAKTTKPKPKPKTKAKTKLTTEEEAAHQTALFKLITKAVMAAPRTARGMQGLSWYEKMLLYDPIVLEDLAGWLNGEGGVVGLAREVAPSVDAGAMRADDEDVDGDEEELKRKWEVKPAVLQKWCEENSVCCLWKGGLRGGVRANY